MALTDDDWSASNHPVIRHRQVAVDRLARSGAPEELLDMFGLSARCIRETVVKLVKEQ
jgi:transketolase C-terminal domain/subunit